MWWFRKNYTVQGGYIPEVGGYNINQVEYCTEEMFMFFGQHLKDVTLKYFVAIYWCFFTNGTNCKWNSIYVDQSVTNIFEYLNIFDPNIYSDIRLYQNFDTNIFGYSFVSIFRTQIYSDDVFY